MAGWSATNLLVMSWLLNAIIPQISTSLIFNILEELESLKAIPDRFPFVSARRHGGSLESYLGQTC